MADAATGRERFSDLRRSLPEQLPAYLGRQRWFGGKARTIRAVELSDVVPVPMQGDEQGALLLIVTVAYSEGTGERYAMPMLRIASPTAPITTCSRSGSGGPPASRRFRIWTSSSPTLAERAASPHRPTWTPVGT